ncbi:uncharacterized protein K452DRAFT_332448 [Aplosporella prunicola CBS 121167]|uniref:non-specific serine/threonine protein kinase n=1 Tax=Aplosporella prunicola CBS 121167 TaxID=1176127 RepID=A0A6A6BF20_9PEZI|nr:uncharacterized protein K452DRAFT_332448 [Aplosporella prunicola CBS 121167]KAF2142666.1 hypothetical protein K452DRAFT_332448 [Aplosporella prunicola CBS 121167]
MVAHLPAHHGADKYANGNRRPQSRGAQYAGTPRPEKQDQSRGTPGPAAHHARTPRPATAGAEREKPPSKDGHAQRAAQDVAGLQDYQLGDCLGKGAFGSVYRALNWGTGETVAVKQVKLVDLPKNELRVIMLEIDLLKNLNHPNIVKYHGFVKDAQSLYIILEYCENGSLHSICKNFGKFPENLVAIYMSQVLHGLLYLHEQGVIHRDIKGANILTTKEGLVKLADFGVATKTAGLHDSAVVGTPYWMAPEVIELSGATTASDIWSLGCTVIELLEGKPPYHKLQPMPALFRIVNDDHPPLPEAASPVVRDFLMQCFQKDPNLRVSARKLLKHPWIMNARRADSVVPTKPTKYDEAVKSVQEWNEALKSPTAESLRLRKASRATSNSPIPSRKEPPPPIHAPGPPPSSLRVDKTRQVTEIYASSESEDDDNWDDDFASSISESALKLPHLRPHDNFAGMLSAEKLKLYATSFDTVSEAPSSNEDLWATDVRVKSPIEMDESEEIKTIRPQSGHNTANSRPSLPNMSSQRQPSQPKTQFFRGLSKSALSTSAPTSHPRLTPLPRPTSAYKENGVEDYSDLGIPDDNAFQKKLQSLKHGSKGKGGSLRGGRPLSGEIHHPAEKDAMTQRSKSQATISKYAENEEEDFSDVFGTVNDAPRMLMRKTESECGSERGTLRMAGQKLSGSWLGDEEDEDDPFAQLEEGFDELDQESNVARDRHARLCNLVENMVSSLKSTQPDDVLFDISDQLLQILLESPDLKNVIISSHGMLPILEILESLPRREIILNLLKIVNIIIMENVEIQENLCFVGGIPIITLFAHRKFSSEIRQEAAAFVRQMYQTSTLTLQMFVGCGGLNVLVEFLEEDLEDERDFVLIGVNGVWSVFNLQGPTPKNDFCRIFSRSSVLYPLSLVLSKVLEEDGEVAELIEERIVGIFMLFSQAETHVKELVADRMVLKRVLKDLQRMRSSNQITMLKFIKNLSMLTTTHEALQNSNAIEVLTDLLKSSMKLPHFREVSNQILSILYNLCRLSKPRQEDAALNGVIPLLQTIVRTEWPLKEFALPILCDMAHSGKVGRKILWQNKGLQFYISLLSDKYWQVTALDAIFIWLQEETARVEQALVSGAFSTAIINCFTNPDASLDAFENLLEPLQKLLRLSPPVAAMLAHPDLFSRTAHKLYTKKPVVRLNLLRIIRSICDATEESGGGAPLIQTYGLYDAIKRLAENDTAILVREMANELIKACDNQSMLTPSTPHARRMPEFPRSRPSSVHRQSSHFNTHGLPPPMPPMPSGLGLTGMGPMSPLPPPTPPRQLSRKGSFWDMSTESPRNSARSGGSRPRTRDGSGDSSQSNAAYVLGHSRDGSVADYHREREVEPEPAPAPARIRARERSHMRGESDASNIALLRPHNRDDSASSTGSNVSGGSRSGNGHGYSQSYDYNNSWGFEEVMQTANYLNAPDSPVPGYHEGRRGSGGNQKSRLPININVRPNSRRNNGPMSPLPNGSPSAGGSGPFVVGTPPSQIGAGWPTAAVQAQQRLAVRRRRQPSGGFVRRNSRQDDYSLMSGLSGLSAAAAARHSGRPDDGGGGVE